MKPSLVVLRLFQVCEGPAHPFFKIRWRPGLENSIFGLEGLSLAVRSRDPSRLLPQIHPAFVNQFWN